MTGAPAALIADDVMEIIEANAEALDSAIIYDRDFSYDYFGFKTLERSYLLKLEGQGGRASTANADARLRGHPQG